MNVVNTQPVDTRTLTTLVLTICGFSSPFYGKKGLTVQNNRLHTPKGVLGHCRNTLQLNQSELARLFGISRSYFHLMEKGQRPVPTHFLLDLVTYANAMEATEELPVPVQKLLQTERVDCMDFLLRTRADLHYSLLGLERKLAQLTDTRQRLLQKLRGIAAILATGNCGQRATTFLRLLDEDCQEQLQLYSQLRLLRLQLKIEGAKQLLVVIEGLLEGG